MRRVSGEVARLNHRRDRPRGSHRIARLRELLRDGGIVEVRRVRRLDVLAEARQLLLQRLVSRADNGLQAEVDGIRAPVGKGEEERTGGERGARLECAPPPRPLPRQTAANQAARLTT